MKRPFAKSAPPDPRKPTGNTSYQAKGSVPVDSGAYKETGSSRITLRDRNPQFANRNQAVQIYDEMANNDVSVDVSLRAAKVPVMGGNFFMQAFDDKPLNQEISEFVSFNIFESSSQPFLLILEEIMRMYEYGFSMVEPVWELREWSPRRTGANRRKYTMLKKLGPRPAPNVKEFVYDDNGGPVSIKYSAIRADNKPEDVVIPIDKLVIFTFNKKGGNLEGKSLLRTAYKNWYYKDNLYKIDGIQKERHGIGVPRVKLLPGYTEADVRAAWELVRNIRTNEEAGIVQSPAFEVDFAKVEGQLVNVLDSIEHHDGRIMLNVMVQFLLLGLTVGGGRATSGSHLDMFQKSLRYVANMICDAFNLYLIPKIVGYNYDTAEFPRMRVRNIGEAKDIQMWASAMSNLASQNLITLDLETEQFIREVIDFPFKLGGKQTPEANASGGGGFNKGGVQTGGATDTSGGTSADPGTQTA